MAGEKAYLFVFTDWHLKGSGRRPEEWIPFEKNQPPETKAIRDLTQEVNQRLDKLLPRNIPKAKRINLGVFAGGIDVIGSGKGSIEWEKVWAVLVDRDCACAGNHSDKLELMAQGLDGAMSNRSGHLSIKFSGYTINLFIAPRGDGGVPDALTYYQRSFSIYNIGSSDEFIALAAGTLAGLSQQVDSGVVKLMQARF